MSQQKQPEPAPLAVLIDERETYPNRKYPFKYAIRRLKPSGIPKSYIPPFGCRSSSYKVNRSASRPSLLAYLIEQFPSLLPPSQESPALLQGVPVDESPWEPPTESAAFTLPRWLRGLVKILNTRLF